MLLIHDSNTHDAAGQQTATRLSIRCCMLRNDAWSCDVTHMVGMCYRRPWTLRDSIVVGQQLAAGMAADHELGFMHGDLKPNNVGVSDQFGELLVKILDFGRVLNSNQTTLTWTQGMP